MARQITNSIAMVRPIAFYFNEETAANDFFQKNLGEKRDVVQAKALIEFDGFVDKLREKGITVNVIQDDDSVFYTPDSIFPNNWFVSLEDNKLVLCPMFAKDRRTERTKFLGSLVAAIGKDTLEIHDYTKYEAEGRYLEGTGAMILDRVNKKAYCCLSERADEGLFRQFCADFGFKPVPFHGFQTYREQRVPIYHTNVMMALGEKFAVVCLSAIDDEKERQAVVDELTESGKEILDVSEDEIDNFAGNEIELEGADGKRYTVMTHSTFNVLTDAQKAVIEKSSEILIGDVHTIETYGGGSVRCMISELY
ncbi:citrulline utilization hydrolase CtlX [Crenobacter intestini]|uniref:Amidinotransferase n=1 Tax=Crenobacter intestini TaxID=2563443 RepID=A0A4T0UWP0_9NEIS|nr:arginine deiminase-related protein [Crenobacter intestini]TIC83499.1 amidinotransferase [Crenobacter intestini]